MLTRMLAIACLVAALVACERAPEPAPAAALTEAPPRGSDSKTISAAPEHFDRMRAEQFEKEEERLRKRARN